jgi:hypothetical protein
VWPSRRALGGRAGAAWMYRLSCSGDLVGSKRRWKPSKMSDRSASLRAGSTTASGRQSFPRSTDPQDQLKHAPPGRLSSRPTQFELRAFASAATSRRRATQATKKAKGSTKSPWPLDGWLVIQHRGPRRWVCSAGTKKSPVPARTDGARRSCWGQARACKVRPEPSVARSSARPAGSGIGHVGHLDVLD